MKRSQKIKNEARIRRRRRVRAKVIGTAKYPRLSIYRSLNHIYAQLIDDASGKTIASASDKGIKATLESRYGVIESQVYGESSRYWEGINLK